MIALLVAVWKDKRAEVVPLVASTLSYRGQTSRAWALVILPRIVDNRVAVFLVGGWHDAFQRGAPLNYAVLQNAFAEFNHRFDDIHHRFCTLYCAELPETCLREVLADFRPKPTRCGVMLNATGPRQRRTSHRNRSPRGGVSSTSSFLLSCTSIPDWSTSRTYPYATRSKIVTPSSYSRTAGVWEIVGRYFPGQAISDRSRLLVEDLIAQRG